jgi:hypothetical protein
MTLLVEFNSVIWQGHGSPTTCPMRGAPPPPPREPTFSELKRAYAELSFKHAGLRVQVDTLKDSVREAEENRASICAQLERREAAHLDNIKETHERYARRRDRDDESHAASFNRAADEWKAKLSDAAQESASLRDALADEKKEADRWYNEYSRTATELKRERGVVENLKRQLHPEVIDLVSDDDDGEGESKEDADDADDGEVRARAHQRASRRSPSSQPRGGFTDDAAGRRAHANTYKKRRTRR